MLVATMSAAPADEYLAQYRWDLTELYADWTAWEAELEELLSAVTHLGELQTEAFSTSKELLDGLRHWDDVFRRADKVEGYVRLRFDLDRNDAEALARRPRLTDLDSRWARASGWFGDAVRAVPEEALGDWLAESADLAIYRRRIARWREGPPSADDSHAIELDRILSGTLGRLFSVLSSIETPSPDVRLSNGESVELSQAKVRSLLATLPEADDRRRVARAWYEARGERADSYAAVLEGVVRRRLTLAGLEGPDEVLSVASERFRLPVATLEQLLDGAEEGLDALRGYHSLRRKRLGGGYGMADVFVPLVAENGASYAFEDVERSIVAAASAMGPEVRALAKRVFSDGWLDLGTGKGRRPGANVSWVGGEHPYILLNWNGSFRDALSAAHETGHALHRMLANAHQPYVYSSFPTLQAETAAITLESLFAEHLEHSAGPERGRLERLDLSVQILLRTYYRTVLAADFETEVYRAVAAGGSLTGDRVGDLYLATLRKYYGDAVDLESWDRHAWMDVRHFFTSPTYMFQYGISYAAACGFLEQLEGEAPDSGPFVEFLEAGSSRRLEELLALSGVEPLEAQGLRAPGERLRTLVRELESID